MDIFAWVPALVSAWARGAPATLTISALLFCFGIVGAGFMFHRVGDDTDRLGVSMMCVLASIALGAFWPFLLIAAGPIACLVFLFVGGINVSKSLKERRS
jgi:hypothetical protein